MSDYSISLATLLIGTLVVGTVNVILTDKAQKDGHDDYDGRVYYAGTLVWVVLATISNLIILINTSS